MDIVENVVGLSLVIIELSMEIIAFFRIFLDVKDIARTHLHHQQIRKLRKNASILFVIAFPVYFSHNHNFYCWKLGLHELLVALIAVVDHSRKNIISFGFELFFK